MPYQYVIEPVKSGVLSRIGSPPPVTGHFDQTTADSLSRHARSNITPDIGPIRRGRRSSASFAIHDISGIPGSPLDRVEEFGSWWAPGGAPKRFHAIFGRILRV